MEADAALLAPLHEGARVTLAFPVALVLAGLLCFVQRYTYAGFRLQVSGEAPLAARHAGYSQRAAVWIAMLTGGACAGFAGYAEVAGPLGQLQPSVSPVAAPPEPSPEPPSSSLLPAPPGSSRDCTENSLPSSST